MDVSSQGQSVTSPVTNCMQALRPATRLAKPYHYRRNGIYYLRIRETGSTVNAVSVSLRTPHRKVALAASAALSASLQAYHLGCPQISWGELKTHLLELVDRTLRAVAPSEHPLRYWGGFYDNAEAYLPHGAALDQPAAGAAGSCAGMAGVKDELRPVTFASLSTLYMTDRESSQKPSTAKETKVCHRVIAEHLGDLDLRSHSRADLVSFRERMAVGRMPSTVNKLIVKLSAVLAWAVENGHLSKAYDKKLKLTKGLESTRKAFTQAQVQRLMNHASCLPGTSWKRWLLSLGIITGGRLKEICQLTIDDVVTLPSGVVAIHINEAGEGKSIKNKRSERLVPLTDGAYGFDLAAFMKYVEACEDAGTRTLAQIGYRPSGEWLNQQAIPAALGDAYERGLVFHSLRHSLASLMQAKGIPTVHAQAVMGHASGTVTFDTYGKGVPVETIAEVLNELFSNICT